MESLLPVYRAFLTGETKLALDEADEILDFALRAGLGPLLRYSSKDHHLQQQSRAYSRLLGADMTARLLTGKQLDALAEIAQAASQSMDAPIALKGMALAHQYYPEPYMRTMGDIDLLVKADQQQPLENICLDLGYVRKSHLPSSFYQNLHHSMPLYHPGNEVWVEVHKALFPQHSVAAADSAFAIANIHREAHADLPGPFGLKVLSAELELLYTCTHWALEANWLKGATRILDVLFILRDRSAVLDWDKIFYWLRTSPVAAKSLYLMTSYLLERGLLDLPNAIVEQLGSCQNIGEGDKRLLLALIDKYTLKGKPFGRVLSQTNADIMWTTLLESRGSALANLLFYLPKNILLPPSNPDRHSLQFQLSRIRSLFNGL